MSAGFLSEMDAMPLLGGGITLKRTIGDEVEKFAWFAKTIHFPGEPVPAYRTGANFYYPYWSFSKWLRPVIGCRASCFLEHNYVSRVLHALTTAKRLARDLGPRLEGAKVLLCPNSLSSLLVARHLRKLHSFEYTTWVMDDHLVRWENGGWCYPLAGSEMLLRQNLRGARHVYVISAAMQEFYHARFGVESTVLASPAEVSTQKPRRSGSATGALRLVYFGSLGRWQNDAINLLTPFLEKGEVALDVYSQNSEAIPPELRKAGAVLKGRCAPEKVFDTICDYDAMVLPISFKPELRNMSYFNIATKFSECLAAPVPTLLIGPEDAIMVKTARAAGACAVVSDPNHVAVQKVIETLKDPARRQAILELEWKLLKEQFSCAVMKKRWSNASDFLFSDK